MGLTSALSNAEDGLLAAIIAQKGLGGSPLADVAVQIGDPGSGLQREHVWIAEEADADQAFAATAGTSEEREERLNLRVFVFSSLGGDHYTELRDRAEALGGEIEKAVRADRDLGNSTFDAELVRIERQGGRTDEGRVMLLILTVSAIAYLS